MVLRTFLFASLICSALSHNWIGVPLRNCSLSEPACFNLQNCAKGFSVYVYPTPDGQTRPTCNLHRLGPNPLVFESGVREKVWFQACATHTIISSGFQLTDNPNEACLFFSTVEACQLNDCDQQQRAEVQAKFWTQPHWNGGKNHIVWDYWTDHDLPGFDVGKAMVVGGAITSFTYRPKYDVILPLTRPHIFEPRPEVEYAGHRVARLIANNAPFTDIKQVLLPVARGRNLTMTFRGFVYGFPGELCAARSRIFGQFLIPPTDQPDVAITAECFRDQKQRPPHLRVKHCEGCIENTRTVDGKTVSCTAGFPDIHFNTGLLRAKFVFAPAGCGPLSFRLSEGLGWGAVPVLAGKGTVLPLAGDTSVGQLWQKCVVHVTEEETATLIQRLRAMPDQEYYERLAACVQLAALKVHELDVLVKHSMCVFAARIAEALGPSRSWDNPELASICESVGITDLS